MAEGEKSTFRCIDAARYALAFAVSVLIVTVAAYAIVVVLRPEPLILSVVGGFVSVEQNQSLPQQEQDSDSMIFSFNLRANNPSGRVRINYTSILVSLYGENASTSPATVKKFLRFQLPNITLAQQVSVDSFAQVTGNLSGPYQKPYFDMLSSGSSIPDAVMQLNGTLTVEIYSGHSTTPRPTVYCCSTLTIGGDPVGNKAGDAPCRVADKATSPCV